jgi:hypothetical protein
MLPSGRGRVDTPVLGFLQGQLAGLSDEALDFLTAGNRSQR